MLRLVLNVYISMLFLFILLLLFDLFRVILLAPLKLVNLGKSFTANDISRKIGLFKFC